MIRQYTARQVLAAWAVVTAPMAVLAFGVGPLLAPHVPIHRGLLHWVLMTIGMSWQCVVSLVLLRREGRLTRRAVLEGIRAVPPVNPRTGQADRRMWWWVVPAIGLNLLGGYLAGPLDDVWSRLVGLSEPVWANISVLIDRQFAGQWWILGLAVVSSVFNYVLGEELFFRGVLLPRMRGAFGRWDWVVNTVLFGLYHVHKLWFWPSMILGSFGIAWSATRFRSFWMAVAVHGVEGIFVVLVFAVVAGWYP